MRLLRSFRRLAGRHRLYVRARRVRALYRRVDPLEGVIPMTINGRLMNRPETYITQALNELKIRNIPQYSILGGDYLGGARMDWYLPDYKIDIEYNGPFHQTTYGLARDALRNMGVTARGIRVEKIHEHDLVRIKARIMEIVGRKG